MASGILEILSTISRTVSAFFTGSPAASSTSRFALYCIKSFAFSSKKATISSLLCFRENESGSSPSGKEQTLTFIPCSRIKSIPRSAARCPAASPSKRTVIFLVSLFINRICSGVSAVPEDETTFSIPD